MGAAVDSRDVKLVTQLGSGASTEPVYVKLPRKRMQIAVSERRRKYLIEQARGGMCDDEA